MFSLPAISDLQGLVERCPRSVPPRSGPDGRRDLPRPELRRLDRLEMRKESRGAAVQLMVQNTDHIEQRLGSMAIYRAMLGSLSHQALAVDPDASICGPKFAECYGLQDAKLREENKHTSQ